MAPKQVNPQRKSRRLMSQIKNSAERLRTLARVEKFPRPASSYSSNRLPRILNRNRHRCSVCTIDKTRREYVFKAASRSCAHASTNVCRECIGNWVSAQIDAGRFTNIACPAPHCNAVLTLREISRVISSQQLQTLKQLLWRVEKNADPLWRWCPAPNCEAGDRRPQQRGVVSLKCRECQTDSCLLCDRLHKGETCEQLDSRTDPVKGARSATQNYLSAKTQVCPGRKCGVRVQKGRGCDHMTCVNCRHEWCWICRADYTIIARHGIRYHQPSCKHYRADNDTIAAWFDEDPQRRLEYGAPTPLDHHLPQTGNPRSVQTQTAVPQIQQHNSVRSQASGAPATARAHPGHESQILNPHQQQAQSIHRGMPTHQWNARNQGLDPLESEFQLRRIAQFSNDIESSFQARARGQQGQAANLDVRNLQALHNLERHRELLQARQSQAPVALRSQTSRSAQVHPTSRPALSIQSSTVQVHSQPQQSEPVLIPIPLHARAGTTQPIAPAQARTRMQSHPGQLSAPTQSDTRAVVGSQNVGQADVQRRAQAPAPALAQRLVSTASMQQRDQSASQAQTRARAQAQAQVQPTQAQSSSQASISQHPQSQVVESPRDQLAHALTHLLGSASFVQQIVGRNQRHELVRRTAATGTEAGVTQQASVTVARLAGDQLNQTNMNTIGGAQTSFPVVTNTQIRSSANPATTFSLDTNNPQLAAAGVQSLQIDLHGNTTNPRMVISMQPSPKSTNNARLSITAQTLQPDGSYRNEMTPLASFDVPPMSHYRINHATSAGQNIIGQTMTRLSNAPLPVTALASTASTAQGQAPAQPTHIQPAQRQSRVPMQSQMHGTSIQQAPNASDAHPSDVFPSAARPA